MFLVDLGWSRVSKEIFVLGPLEGLGRLYPREDGVDLSRDLLEVAVGEGGLCPAEDACDEAFGLLVAPIVFLGEMMISLVGVLHGSIHLRGRWVGVLLLQELLLLLWWMWLVLVLG